MPGLGELELELPDPGCAHRLCLNEAPCPPFARHGASIRQPLGVSLRRCPVPTPPTHTRRHTHTHTHTHTHSYMRDAAP
eukprot:COSAG01_NODE_676_length_14324_cov_17.420105_9_plen_79_part_00